MGSIFLEKSGPYAGKRYRGVVELPKGPDGKRRQKVFYGDPSQTLTQQKRELQAKINELEYEIRNNLYLKETEATLIQYLKDWLKVYAANNLAETTQELYQMYVDVHIAPSKIANIKVKELRPMHIQDFYNEKLEKLSPNSVRKLHSFLNNALDDAIMNRLIKYNPCQGAKPPKKVKYEPEICTEDNFLTLLEHTKGTLDEVLILLAGVCGLRRGEIFGLRFVDIDFKQNKISIRKTKVRMNGNWILKDPKSNSSIRTISVPDFVTVAIQNYLSSLRVVPEFIFEEYQPDAYSKHFRALLKKYDLPQIRFHDLRHFNAVIMLKYGVPDKVASKRLGHSQVQITREIYQHVLPDMDKHAANVIESVFSKKEERNVKTEGQ